MVAATSHLSRAGCCFRNKLQGFVVFVTKGSRQSTILRFVEKGGVTSRGRHRGPYVSLVDLLCQRTPS